MKIFQQFTKDQGNTVVAHRMCATKKDDHQRNGELTTCCQVVRYLLVAYATEDVIVEAEA